MAVVKGHPVRPLHEMTFFNNGRIRDFQAIHLTLSISYARCSCTSQNKMLLKLFYNKIIWSNMLSATD